MIKNVYYLNGKIQESFRGSLTSRLSLAVTTGPIPLACVELQLAPHPTVDFFVPDELQEVIGSYDRGRFIRIAVTGPEGPVVGIGDFTKPKWFDIPKFKGISEGIEFPHEAPADWNGQHAGWVNKYISKVSLKSEDRGGLRMEMSLSSPDKEDRVDIYYRPENVGLVGEHIRSILQVASTKTWTPEGRYVRVRKSEKGAICIGHLFEDIWFNTQPFWR